MLLTLESIAQDVEPRRWTPIPLDTRVIGAGYAFTQGEVLFDPSLLAEDVKIQIHTVAFSYVHPLRIGKKFARLGILIPVNFEDWNGLLEGVPRSVKRSGLVDPRIRFSINLIGAPASNLKDLQQFYQENPTHTTLGFSLAIRLPLGQYDESKLINIGENRFMFRPQLGLEHRWGPWSYELTGSVFFYSENNEFFPDQRKVTDPIYAIQNHLIRRFKKGMWLAVDLGYGYGGESSLDTIPLADYRSNLVVGGSVGVRIDPRQAIKLVYFRKEALNSVGSDVNSFGLVWTMVLF
ncbi:hypothetical protein BST85_02890 [Aureitalea marina]|uniref:Transporter n=1 Tax=Aureitalea marina TaxID=930804 RepID=A0A2S7KTH3_9FLAO|nr:hypothetical protein BST85_02890 [Aureitalea marina]